MPICGTQLTEWFRERGILTAAYMFRVVKPSRSVPSGDRQNGTLAGAIADPIIAQHDRAGNPASATLHNRAFKR